jgi:hypothetical protein
MLRPCAERPARARKSWQGLRECSFDRAAHAAFQIIIGRFFKGGIRRELRLLRRVIAVLLRSTARMCAVT